METLASLVQGLTEGSVTVVDLTQPLSEWTPLIRLPEPFVNTPGWKLHELSRYDERGPAWYWNAFEGGEHMGTHFDAPIHWASGQDKDDVSEVPVRNLVGLAVVIDKSAECAPTRTSFSRSTTSGSSSRSMANCPKAGGYCTGRDGTPGPTTRTRS
jgi:kynurenine formamidase